MRRQQEGKGGGSAAVKGTDPEGASAGRSPRSPRLAALLRATHLPAQEADILLFLSPKPLHPSPELPDPGPALSVRL